MSGQFGVTHGGNSYDEEKQFEIDVCLNCKYEQCIEERTNNHAICMAKRLKAERDGYYKGLESWGHIVPKTKIVNTWQKERRRMLMDIEENRLDIEPLNMTDEELVNSYNATLKTKAQWLDDMAEAMGIDRSELRDRLKNLGVKGNTFNRLPEGAQRKSAEARKRNNAEKKAAEKKAAEQKAEPVEDGYEKATREVIDALKAQVADRDARIAKLERWIIDMIVK